MIIFLPACIPTSKGSKSSRESIQSPTGSFTVRFQKDSRSRSFTHWMKTSFVFGRSWTAAENHHGFDKDFLEIDARKSTDRHQPQDGQMHQALQSLPHAQGPERPDEEGRNPRPRRLHPQRGRQGQPAAPGRRISNAENSGFRQRRNSLSGRCEPLPDTAITVRFPVKKSRQSSISRARFMRFSFPARGARSLTCFIKSGISRP